MTPSESIKIVIHLQRRRDGGLRAWSDDVPGLVLSHSDANRVMADIIPAVETIMAETLGYPVKASELVPVRKLVARSSPQSGRSTWLGGILRNFAEPRSETREYAATACFA